MLILHEKKKKKIVDFYTIPRIRNKFHQKLINNETK